MGVIVVLTCDGEVEDWWPEEGQAQSHPLVVGREWVNGESNQLTVYDCSKTSLMYTSHILYTGSLKVITTDETVSMTNPDLLVRSCDLYSSADNERDTVIIYHYTAWPHNSAPSSIDHMADMYQSMLASRLQQKVSSVRTYVSR